MTMKKTKTKDYKDKDDDAHQVGVGGVSGLMNRPRAVRHLVEALLIYTGCEHCNIVAHAHSCVMFFLMMHICEHCPTPC